MKIIRKFSKVKLIGVDIDTEMLRLGKKWFALDDQRTTCVIDDGLKYLDAQLQEKSSFFFVFRFIDFVFLFFFEENFDVIIFDVNNDDNQSSLRCPHPSFLNDNVLSNVHQLLSANSGVFILNFASRDSSSPDRDQTRTRLSNHFLHLSSLKLDDDINEIFISSDQSLEKIQKNKSKKSDLNEFLEKLRLEK